MPLPRAYLERQRREIAAIPVPDLRPWDYDERREIAGLRLRGIDRASPAERRREWGDDYGPANMEDFADD